MAELINEATPAMIAAGVAELERQYLDITGGATEEDFQRAVAAIYREMEKAKERSQRLIQQGLLFTNPESP